MRAWLLPQTALALSEADAGWLAGFIDGEGSIVFGLSKKRFPVVTIQAVNTSLAAIEKCRLISGCGSIIVKDDNARRLGTKRVYKWQVSAQRDVMAILRQIEPHLVIKREKASRAIGAWRDVA